MVNETHWSGWSLGMLWSHIVLGATALVVVGLAVPLFASDMSSHDDEWDGLAAGIAVIFGGLALAFLACCVVLHLLTRRGRRRAGSGDAVLLRRTAATTVVVAAGWVSICLTQLAQGAGWSFGLVMSTPGLLLLVPAAGCWHALLDRRPA